MLNCKNVVVVGPMSSGCRLLRRILDKSPNICCYLDTSHGSGNLIENGKLIPEDSIIIVIIREKYATDGSREKRWAGKSEYINYEDSMSGIQSRYKDALIIKYEDLCEDLNFEITKIVDYLQIPGWIYKGRMKNRNYKWLRS